MRKLVVLLVAGLFVQVSAWAGDGEYAVNRIPLSMIKNANAVKRLEEEQFTVKNPGEAYYKWKYVVTILNENGDGLADFYQYYDKFIDIRSIEGTLYDAAGKELRKLKNKDIQDVSGTDNSLIDDMRFKVHNFYYKVYPYTIAYEVELKYNGTMFYPDWFPQSRALLSVEQSRFIFSCPKGYEFRYKACQYNGTPVESQLKDDKVYTWEIRNLPAISGEPYSPGIRRIAPLVLFGPTEFEMQDYKGNMKSWQDLGKFIYALKQGRDVLPDDVKQTVHQLTDHISNPSEKVKLLYEYLQKTTRYISIQLGIGGWQPFDAKFVATKKYGDCKALSNYMFSLLKEAGIASYYTVIRAGEGADDIFADFPSSQFNHIILCVPFPRDTMWLECTSQTLPAGYLSGFTADRFALLVDERGGHLMRTPRYGFNENVEIRHIKAVLDDQATLQVDANTRYGGQQQDKIHKLINHLSKDKVKEYLQDELDFATYDIKRFEYKENKSTLPTIDESLDISVSNYATITGKRLFINPNVMTRSYQKLSADTARKYDIQTGFEYMDIDTVEIELPKGYEAEVIPKDITVSSKFGHYKCAVKLEGNKLVYYRSVQRFSGRFPAKDYPDMVKFSEAVYKADRNRVVLVKNETLKAF